ncbi:MAG: RpiB/LacA/LacB family sugar-phosphate isomerase [Dysgonomonas sp.]
MNKPDKDLVCLSGKPVGLCCDHAGFELKQFVIKLLSDNGIVYEDFGTYTDESCDYADYAHKLANAVESGKCYPGIAICGSGNGINMTLNKHQLIRSALCWTAELSRLSRAHNNANILTLPARFITEEEAYKAIKTFFETPFEGGRHQKRIEKIPV